MDKKIRRMYLQDCFTILTFMIFMWVVFAYVIGIVSSVVNNHLLATAIIVIGVFTVLFASSTMFAVLVHLKKNRDKLYMEDICNYEKQKQ